MKQYQVNSNSIVEVKEFENQENLMTIPTKDLSYSQAKEIALKMYLEKEKGF